MREEVEKVRLQNKQNLMEIANRFVGSGKEDETPEAEEELIDFLQNHIYDDDDLKELQDKLKAVFGRTLNFNTASSKFYFAKVDNINPKTGRGKVVILEHTNGNTYVLGKDDEEFRIHGIGITKTRNKVDATAEQIAEFLSYLSPSQLENLLNEEDFYD